MRYLHNITRVEFLINEISRSVPYPKLYVVLTGDELNSDISASVGRIRRDPRPGSVGAGINTTVLSPATIFSCVSISKLGRNHFSFSNLSITAASQFLSRRNIRFLADALFHWPYSSPRVINPHRGRDCDMTATFETSILIFLKRCWGN